MSPPQWIYPLRWIYPLYVTSHIWWIYPLPSGHIHCAALAQPDFQFLRLPEAHFAMSWPGAFLTYMKTIAYSQIVCTMLDRTMCSLMIYMPHTMLVAGLHLYLMKVSRDQSGELDVQNFTFLYFLGTILYVIVLSTILDCCLRDIAQLTSLDRYTYVCST